MAGAQSLFTSIFGSPIPGPVRGRTGGTAAGRATASAVGTTTRAVGKVVTDPRFQAAVKTASAATQIGANIKALTTKPPKPPRPDDKKVQDAGVAPWQHRTPDPAGRLTDAHVLRVPIATTRQAVRGPQGHAVELGDAVAGDLGLRHRPA
jgi:hypothetical protein